MSTTSDVRPNADAAADVQAGAWTDRRSGSWETICRLDRLQPGRGAAALLGPGQVALFRLSAPDGGPDTVLVIDNIDPFSGAAVLSRGIVGDRGGEPVVASPVYKQAFSLLTGRCVDDPQQEVAVHQARIVNGWVQVALP